ncbi:MAG: DUF3365 domain-containing protein [Hydrogenimonas sp.]|nr:DUF3365 domain-containing protein [Hydrogenimonas sp.]
MFIKRIVTLSVVASLALFASTHETKGESCSKKSELSKVVKKGKEASKLLLKTLGGNMKKHMKAGGPADALSFCATNAAGLTAEVDEKLGKDVSVKRITLKPRNPANMAEGDEKVILKSLQSLKDSGVKLPKYLIQKKSNEYRFYKPLLINKKVCLKCHGTDISPKLKAEIDKIYPTDRATGYKMGDLRGAVVVTIKR